MWFDYLYSIVIIGFQSVKLIPKISLFIFLSAAQNGLVLLLVIVIVFRPGIFPLICTGRENVARDTGLIETLNLPNPEKP